MNLVNFWAEVLILSVFSGFLWFPHRIKHEVRSSAEPSGMAGGWNAQTLFEDAAGWGPSLCADSSGTKKAANSLFRTLFSAGAWLDEVQARAVGEQGLLLLRCYWTLGKFSLEKKEPRYPIHPKFHMLCHHFDFLPAPLEKGAQWIESPLCDSCQIDESFVGCISRYSRRVSPKQTIWRTWDLYLSSVWSRWKDSKPGQSCKFLRMPKNMCIISPLAGWRISYASFPPKALENEKWPEDIWSWRKKAKPGLDCKNPD